MDLADAAGDSPLATSFSTRERTRAWLSACRGDLASARERIRETIPAVHRDEMYIFELTLLHDLVRLGVPEEAVERLEVLAGVIDGPVAPIHAAHARALVDRDVDAQGAVVDRYEAIDSLGMAAEAAAELADLHRSAGARLATAASTFGRPRGSGGRPAYAGDDAAPVSSRSRRVSGRSPCWPLAVGPAGPSASTSACRRGPSTRTWLASTASSGSVAGPNCERLSAEGASLRSPSRRRPGSRT